MIKDKYADEIIDILNESGYEAYYVGGCVRDALLGVQPGDFDITTNAKPDETADVFSQKGYRIVETGLKHGTISIICDKRPYEVTTFRVDGEYVDGRHPESVRFVSSLREDLARRDFTVNAMAYHPKMGIVDYFGGQEDIGKRVIRCVGEPVKRFEEDALRILRALRFAGRLGFSIEERTSAAVNECRELLKKISAERIYSELCNILLTDSAADILEKYVDVFGVFIPELMMMVGFEQKTKWHVYDVFKHTVVALKNSPKDLIVRLAVLFHDVGKPHVCVEDAEGFRHFRGHQKVSCELAGEILRRLRADNKTRERVCRLILHHDDRIPVEETAVLRLMRRMGEDTIRSIEVEKADNSAQNPDMVYGRFVDLGKIEKLYEKLKKKDDLCLKLSDLDISGSDVISCGVKAGPKVGEVLEALLEEVTEKRLPNEKEALVEFVKNHF